MEVLIVDDSASLRMSVSLILKMAGHSPKEANSAEDALAQLTAGRVKPGLLLVDLNMTGINGIEFIRRVRAQAAFRFVPILMLTTESQQERRVEAKSAGATGWLVKPVAPNDLLGVIKQVCHSS